LARLQCLCIRRDCSGSSFRRHWDCGSRRQDIGCAVCSQQLIARRHGRQRRRLCLSSSPVCYHIFNSVTWGSTIANIFALHKKGPKDLAKNYRPISLTSICSKVLEHIVYSSISNFLDDNQILTPHQHGFRSGHSCETQLVLAVNDWAKSLDNGFRTDIAIFDFSKAFDSVPHRRLLLKLDHLGICGRTKVWISSFLSDRSQ